MGFQYWFTVCATFIVGLITLAESFIYMHRGIYTKTFKGTSRKEFIYKDTKPIEYWISTILHFGISIMMIGIGFWFLQEIPAVNHWYNEIRTMPAFWF